MAMKTVIVESDPQLRIDLHNLLSIHQAFQVVAEVETTEEAFDYIQSSEVDAVFTNILPADIRRTSDGNHLSIVLSQSYPAIQVVIYSRESEDAYQACRSQCAGFLLLPFDPLAFQHLVNRLTYIYDLQQVKRASVDRNVMIKTPNGYQLTRLNDILFFERSARKNRIVTTDGREILLLGYTMKQIEEMLSDRGFYRCYPSFIVNLSKVSFVRVDNEMKNYAVRFRDYDGEIPLSRNKYSEFVELLRSRYAGIKI